MSTIYSVGYFANAYADKQVAGQNPNYANRQLDRDRAIYDFTVTGFNLSTAASIVAVAAAMLINSPVVLILALLICSVRQAFKEGAERAALPNGNRELLQNSSLEEARGHVIEKLNIQQENWNPVKVKLLNFRLLMNWTPVVVPPAAQAGRRQANVELPLHPEAARGAQANLNEVIFDANYHRLNEPIAAVVVQHANHNNLAVGNNENNNYNGGLLEQVIEE